MNLNSLPHSLHKHTTTWFCTDPLDKHSKATANAGFQRPEGLSFPVLVITLPRDPQRGRWLKGNHCWKQALGCSLLKVRDQHMS